MHNVAVAGQRPLTLVLHSMGRFTALRDLSVALFRSYGADNFFASLPPSLTRLRATGLAGFKVPPAQFSHCVHSYTHAAQEGSYICSVVLAWHSVLLLDLVVKHGSGS